MLVDGRGMTLYVFTPDKPNKSLCYGRCMGPTAMGKSWRGTTEADYIRAILG
jgi:predicted lipoprotein with Yx(FWY)xxD motif